MTLYELGSILILGLFSAWIGYGWYFEGRIEQPAYTVKKSFKDFEIREYPSIIIAETMLTNDDQNSGFRVLADYIFGNNISMTAPVINTPNDSQQIKMTAPVLSNTQTMAFVLPSTFTLDTLPKPVNPAVTLREVPKRTIAVIRFRGYANSAQVTKKTDQLKAALIQHNLNANGNVSLAQYNSPFVFPLQRVNEVWIEL